jgi:hypothetical protein
MVNRYCSNCGELFTKKSTYDYHINRKIPCVKIAPKVAPIAPKIAPIAPEISKNIQKVFKQRNLSHISGSSDTFDNNTTNTIGNCKKSNEKKTFSCEYCNKIFSRKFCLLRHQNARCIGKQKSQNTGLNDDSKDNDNNELKELKQINQSSIEIKCHLILKQNAELKTEIEKLKTRIKKNKPQIINNNINTNSNNVINVVNNIINFNDVNYANVDKKLFIEPIMDRKLFGKAIILKMIENIYINEHLPEYQNLVITDKNRGYVKVYNNGKWKTDNLDTINLILNGVVDHSKIIIDELYLRYLNNTQVKNRIGTSEKYIGYCDLEYLGELKDSQENEHANNKNEIKRCEEFREMVFRDTINLFHDNKNILLKLKKI